MILMKQSKYKSSKLMISRHLELYFHFQEDYIFQDFPGVSNRRRANLVNSTKEPRESTKRIS